LRVIRIDPQRRRMGLSLKRAMEAQEGDTLPPQGPLAIPTPRGANDAEGPGGRGGRGGPGNRGGRGRDRQDEPGSSPELAAAGAPAGGEPAAAPAATPAAPPPPVARPAEPEVADTAMARAMAAARDNQAASESQAAGETADAESSVNPVATASHPEPYEPEMGPGASVTPAEDAAGPDTDTATE